MKRALSLLITEWQAFLSTTTDCSISGRIYCEINFILKRTGYAPVGAETINFAKTHVFPISQLLSPQANTHPLRHISNCETINLS